MDINFSTAFHKTRESTLDNPLFWILFGTVLGLIACKLT